MALISDVMDRIVAIVESVTPDTVYFEATRFKHMDLAYDAEDIRTQDATRRFVVLPTGSRDWTGWVGAAGERVEASVDLDLAILYRQGTSAHGFYKVVAEDVDRITWALQYGGNHQEETSGISRIVAASYAMEMADGGANGVAIVSIPLTATYQPSFTG